MLVFQESLRGQKRAIEMDGEHFLSFGKSEFFHGMDDLDAGIADQNANFAVSSFSCVHAFVHRGLVAHVHLDTHGDAVRSGYFAPPRRPLLSSDRQSPPSLAKQCANSLSMPLAAPVTMATLFSKRLMTLYFFDRDSVGKIIVYDLSEIKGEVRDQVDARDHLEHRKISERRQCMGM